MLTWSAAFFIIAIIAAVFGFGGIATGAAEAAHICFFFFLVIFLVTLIWGLVMGRRSGSPPIFGIHHVPHRRAPSRGPWGACPRLGADVWSFPPVAELP